MIDKYFYKQDQLLKMEALKLFFSTPDSNKLKIYMPQIDLLEDIRDV